jgi:hypothetical protein
MQKDYYRRFEVFKMAVIIQNLYLLEKVEDRGI